LATDIELKEIARSLRRDIVSMIYNAGSGHPGGSLSAIDMLVFLYKNIMRFPQGDLHSPNRDRFILSKGHCAPALYVVLAEYGFFPKEELSTLREIGSRLQGHPDMRKTPGVDMTTGSLGMGLSAGIGMALAAKIDNRDIRVYVMAGDGEMQSGQIWEAAMTAGQHKLDNLILLVDKNGYQCDDRVDALCSLGDIAAKLREFNFCCAEADGHDFASIRTAFNEVLPVRDRPKAIIAHTVKGKGVSFMENENIWHGTPPSKGEAEAALEELGKEKGSD